MDKLKCVGISGKMAVGKTQLANYLCEEFGYVKYAFATPMKELERLHQRYKTNEINENELKSLLLPYIINLNIPIHEAGKELMELYNNTPLVLPKNREFLQKLGTDIVRKYNVNAWTEYTINCIKNVDKPIVIDDIRFPNELDTLRKEGFFLVKMTSDDDLRLDRIEKLYGKEALSPLRLNHPSETMLDEYQGHDLLMHNNYDDRLKSYAEALNIYLSARGR